MSIKTNEEWAAIKERLLSSSSEPMPPWFVESMLIDAIDIITRSSKLYRIEHGFSKISEDVLTKEETEAIRYPFTFMKINDSFFVDTGVENPIRLYKRLRRLAMKQSKKRKPIAVTVHAGKKVIDGQMIDGFYLVRRG